MFLFHVIVVPDIMCDGAFRISNEEDFGAMCIDDFFCNIMP